MKQTFTMEDNLTLGKPNLTMGKPQLWKVLKTNFTGLELDY